jgi:hypothetical protein
MFPGMPIAVYINGDPNPYYSPLGLEELLAAVLDASVEEDIAFLRLPLLNGVEAAMRPASISSVCPLFPETEPAPVNDQSPPPAVGAPPGEARLPRWQLVMIAVVLTHLAVVVLSTVIATLSPMISRWPASAQLVAELFALSDAALVAVLVRMHCSRAGQQANVSA